MILFIDENGLWLSVRAGHLALRQRDGSYTWMPERIRTIVAVGHGFCVTAAALHYCVSRHVELFISNEMTGFISLFAPESRIDARYAALKARQKQFAAALDDARTLSVARAIVAMKVQAEGHRNFAEQQFLKSVDNAESVSVVRRIEALSGTAFWRQRHGFELAFKDDASPSWRTFETRYIGRRLGKLGELDKQFTARHASQPMQAMLNFAISISAARMTRCIVACGLDASFGFLHNARKPGRLSLVWDCIEPLRPALACAVFKYAGKRTFERADFISLENKKGEKVIRLSPKTAKDIVPIALGASPVKECFRIVNTVISHF
jgi:CRISPR/Cas system-associated endonuclease Cas1